MSFDREMRSQRRFADRSENVCLKTNRTIYKAPNYEFQRDNDNINLQVELPGVAKEHIDLEMNSGKLTITARRFKASHSQPPSKESEQATEEKGGRDAHEAELPQPSCVYKLHVKTGTNVDDEGIKAEYNHGILNIVLPMKKVNTARKIALTDI
ncbi:Heat shock protein-like [Gracilariopsis chorda]|uniref:Heat shock protein-like n=1 Tax=Gracilariopsis chorda TaxID=448386 RepID=A0A2V3J651_9FLOR|nr:Heat shock protein-like [Gracilariopsis chorda]|eukprot:PXF48860.1 Heat shock protein-like [Gracilariopsis chorda]